MLLLIVRSAIQLRIPAPSASLASRESPEALPTRLLLTVVFARDTVPQLSMPPPNAPANGQLPPPGQGGPKGTVSVGATRLPVITLLLIVTVAPPLKSALGGISMPPPAANTPSCPTNGVGCGFDRVTPPVIVTPSMETVGSVDSPKAPIVSTGPPPLITV